MSRILLVTLILVLLPLPVRSEEEKSKIVPERHFIVWMSSMDGCVKTMWLREREGKVTVLGEAAEIIVASHTQLWVVRHVERSEKLLNCECTPENWNPKGCEEKDQTVDSPVDVMQLVDLASDRVIEAPAPVQDTQYIGELTNTYDAIGSVGPYVFSVGCAFSYSCGAAHGDFVCQFSVADVGQVKHVDVMGEKDAKHIDDVEKKRAVEMFGKREDIDTPEASILTTSRPNFSKGQLTFTYQFTAETCFACSDGDWSAYTASTFIESDFVPALFTEFVKTPDTVKSYLELHPAELPAGWSEVKGSPEEVDRALRLFKDKGATKCTQRSR